MSKCDAHKGGQPVLTAGLMLWLGLVACSPLGLFGGGDETPTPDTGAAIDPAAVAAGGTPIPPLAEGTPSLEAAAFETPTLAGEALPTGESGLPVDDGSTPTPAGPTPSPLPQTFADLIIVNDTERDICEIYAPGQVLDNWGTNLLIDGEEIPEGAEYTFPSILYTIYDLRAVDCDGRMVHERYGVLLGQENITWELSDAEMTIANESPEGICELYLAPNSEGRGGWGPSQIGSPIDAGDDITFTIGAGLWDLRVVFCNGQQIERQDQDITDGIEWEILGA